MTQLRPFRFAVHTSDAADGATWAAAARRYEALCFSSLFVRDHFDDQLAPIVAMTAAACATTTLRVGCLVFDNDYRHPLVAAKEAAAEVRRRGVPAVVVDAEDGHTRLGLAAELADAMGAPCLTLSQLNATTVRRLVSR